METLDILRGYVSSAHADGAQAQHYVTVNRVSKLRAVTLYDTPIEQIASLRAWPSTGRAAATLRRNRDRARTDEFSTFTRRLN